MRRSLKLPSMLTGAALIASAMLSFPVGPAAAAQIYVTACRMPSILPSGPRSVSEHGPSCRSRSSWLWQGGGCGCGLGGSCCSDDNEPVRLPPRLSPCFVRLRARAEEADSPGAPIESRKPISRVRSVTGKARDPRDLLSPAFRRVGQPDQLRDDDSPPRTEP